jgi:hypothetical protein
LRASSVFLLVVLVSGAAEARGRLGLGAQIGEPTALTLEVALTRMTALDLAVGLATFDRDLAYFHLQGVLFPVDLAGGRGSVDVPLYLGVGVAVYDTGQRFADDVRAAIRLPFGIAVELHRHPLQLFLELAVRVQVVEDAEVDLDPSFGARWFF